MCEGRGERKIILIGLQTSSENGQRGRSLVNPCDAWGSNSKKKKKKKKWWCVWTEGYLYTVQNTWNTWNTQDSSIIFYQLSSTEYIESRHICYFHAYKNTIWKHLFWWYCRVHWTDGHLHFHRTVVFAFWQDKMCRHYCWQLNWRIVPLFCWLGAGMCWSSYIYPPCCPRQRYTLHAVPRTTEELLRKLED